MTQIDPRKLIRFDWFIKKMLRDKADFEILEGFLSELLKEDVTILEVVESDSNKENQEDKFNRVDVLVKTADDERVIIEIQNTKELDYLQRIYYGTSKTLVENIKEGAEYKEIKRVISISVIYFPLGVGNDYVYIGETNFRGLHDPTDVLTLSQDQLDFFGNPKINIVSDIFARYYIIRANDFAGDIKDALDEWIYFFKTATVRGTIPAKGLDKAKERLRVNNLEGDELKAYKRFLELQHSNASYEAQFKFELERALKEELEKALKEEVEAVKQEMEKVAKEEVEAVKQEMEKSLEVKAEEMILEMYEDGMPIAKIAKFAKKTIEEVQQIITKHANKK